MSLYQTSCQLTFSSWSLSNSTWLLLCDFLWESVLPFWEQMVRWITNHLIGITHMATDVNRFNTAALVHPQKITGILLLLGCFPNQRSALWSFPKPLINEWPWKKCRPHPCTCCLRWTRGVLIAPARGRRVLSLLTSPATQPEFSHKPKSRALLPHRRSLCGIPGYWVSSRYNLPTTGSVQI